MRNGTLWKADEVAALEKLWKKGTPVYRIAQFLDRTRNSVIGKADRLHLPVHKNTTNIARKASGRAYRENGRLLA